MSSLTIKKLRYLALQKESYRPICRHLAAMRAALLLALVSGVCCLICPLDYTDDGNGNCQSSRQAPSSQILAYAACATNNAYLMNVVNAFDNRQMIDLAGAYDKIWLGLTCTSKNLTSCLWDNGTPVTSSTFTNFYPGHPNTDTGSCVYLASSTGQWFSGSCTKLQAPFVCRATPGIKVTLCPGYSYYFRERCYLAVNALDFDDAAAQCSDACGTVASIHNAGENAFVRDMVNSNSSSAAYGIIGLSYTNNNYVWADYTPFDYTNWGLEMPSLGSCALIATTNDVISRGQWLNYDCGYGTVAVCKKNITCAVPTVSPPTCSGNQFLSGTGTLYSPGYPLGSASNLCGYIITEQAGFTVAISFPEVSLDRNSTIKLYSSVMDTEPFATITDTTSNNQTYYSSSNFLKMVFQAQDNTFFKNAWTANYASQAANANGCGGIYKKAGRISGPTYAEACTYSIRIGTKRSCVKFITANLQMQDAVFVYDGDISVNNQIGQIDKNLQVGVGQVALCSSRTNYLSVVTSAQSKLTYDMFILDAAGSPEELTPVSIVPYASVYVYSTPTVNQGEQDHRITSPYRYGVRSSKHMEIQLTFSLLNMPYPNNTLFVLDGPSGTTALAMGVSGSSWKNMVFQSTTDQIIIYCLFNQQTYMQDLFGILYNATDTTIPGTVTFS